jgi:hypothetical protein
LHACTSSISVFCSCWLRSMRSCSVRRMRISSRLAKSVVACEGACVRACVGCVCARA